MTINHTASAGEIIKGSLRLIGMLAEGEEPSADTMQEIGRAHV